jgi:hypothetical protein
MHSFSSWRGSLEQAGPSRRVGSSMLRLLLGVPGRIIFGDRNPFVPPAGQECHPPALSARPQVIAELIVFLLPLDLMRRA